MTAPATEDLPPSLATPPAGGGVWGRLVWTKRVMRGVPAIAGLIALVCLLLTKPQGSDLVLSITEAPRGIWGGALITALSSLFLGGQAWFWSRRLIDRNTDSALDYPQHPLLLWAPQALGIAPPLIAAVVVVSAGGPLLPMAALLVAVALALSGMLAVRGWISGGERRAAKAGAEQRGRSNPRLDAFADGFARGSMQLAAAAMVAVVAWPVRLPQLLGSIGIVYFGVGFIIPVLAWALLSTRRSRFPVTEALIVWAAFLSAFGFRLGDNHEVGRRALGGQQLGTSGAAPQSLREVFEAWYAQAPGAGTLDHPKPLVVVAVEGGASRAGYWTAEVLGTLQRESQGDFSRSVLALSSVSGGSVGAAAFVSQLHDQRTPGADMTAALTDVAGADFLSPALGGLLFPDLFERLLPPIPWLGRPGAVLALPDRAEPLEEAFEASWRAHCRSAKADCTHPDLWASPLHGVAPGVSGATPRWTPALFVNGAREEDGRRTLTSTVAVDPQIFPDALDFRLASRGDPAISTAILNGARFPIVSPGGTMITPDGRAHGHLLDGGYFEGSGVSTARDILKAALAYAQAGADGPDKAPRYVRPILVEINNDSDDDPGDVRLVRATRVVAPWELVALQPPAATKFFLSDLFGPLLGVSQSRDGRGAAVASALSAEFANAQGPGSGSWGVRPAYRLVHLCKQGRRGMPMDWAVSNEARGIAEWALTNCNNEKTLPSIVQDVHAP